MTTAWRLNIVGFAAQSFGPRGVHAHHFALSAADRMLVGSNVFMTTAWYWHLRFKEVPLFSVILISWGLAFVEYCLAVPANRYGSAVYSRRSSRPCRKSSRSPCSRCSRPSISRTRCTLSQGFGFALIAAGAFFVFHKW